MDGGGPGTGDIAANRVGNTCRRTDRPTAQTRDGQVRGRPDMFNDFLQTGRHSCRLGVISRRGVKKAPETRFL
jgi:hypothetical protein